MNKKYCCSKFEFYHRTDTNQEGVNLRIVKLSNEFVEKGYVGESRYRCLLVENYQNEITEHVRFMNVDFCPFCGKKIENKYAFDDYVNEQNHPW